MEEYPELGAVKDRIKDLKKQRVDLTILVGDLATIVRAQNGNKDDAITALLQRATDATYKTYGD